MRLLRALGTAFLLGSIGAGCRTSVTAGDPAGGDAGGGGTSAGIGGAPGGGVVEAGLDASSSTASASTGPSTSTGGEPFYQCELGESATILASIEWPIAMVQDAGSLYVASYAETGGVYRVAKDGSELVELAAVSFPSGIAIADGWLYVASSGDRELVRVPTAGGTVEHLADFDGPTDVRVEGAWAYVVDAAAETVERVPITGGTPEVMTVNERNIYRMTSYPGNLAFGRSSPDRTYTIDTEGGDSYLIASNDARRLTVFEGWFYATSNEPDPGVIFRTELAGNVDVLLRDPDAIFLEGIAVEEFYLYYARWTGPRTGGVARTRRYGTQVEPLLDVAEPLDVLVDGACVYVSSGQTIPVEGAVRRLGAPDVGP